MKKNKAFNANEEFCTAEQASYTMGGLVALAVTVMTNRAISYLLYVYYVITILYHFLHYVMITAILIHVLQYSIV